MRTLTASALAAFAHCPRKYEYSYLWKIYPIIYNSSRVVGNGLVAGITDIQTTTRFNPLPDAILAARAAMKEDLLKLKKLMDADEFEEVYNRAFRDRAKVCAMLRAYRKVYPTCLPMNRIEGRFEPRPIVNPTTGRDSRTFNLASTYTGLYKLNDGRWMLYELKSTSDSLKEAGQVLAQSIQPQLLMSMVPADVPLAGICIDVVKKPVAPWRKAKAKKKAETLVEPLQDYEDRCYKAYVDRPQRFFRRIMLPVDPSRIRDAQAVAWRVAQDIRDSDKYGYLACRGAGCKNSQGWCDYRTICWHNDTENYRHGEYAHEELELTA